MRLIFFSKIIISLWLLAYSVVGVKADDVPDYTNPQVLETFFDALILPLMEKNHSSGGAVSIVKGGQVIFSKGYGFQNLENQTPVSPKKTLFQVGSVSKLYTWVALMQLVEQGLVDMDTDINQYLAGVKIKDTFPGQPITIRHLMTHTAGFEDGAIGVFYTKSIDHILPLAEAAERYQQERINPPGMYTAYSNYGTLLAGVIVQTVSGVEFKSYIQQNIFDPLGMTKSSFESPLPEVFGQDLANTYSYENGKYVWQPIPIFTNLTPAGSLSSTTEDMMKFMKMLLNGGSYDGAHILKEATLQKMLTRSFSHDDRLSGMGLGFHEYSKNGFTLLGHGGDVTYAHTNFMLDRENDIGIFAVFNGVGGRPVRSAVVPKFYEEFFPIHREPLTPPAGFAARAEKYAGTYNFWRGNVTRLDKISVMSSGMPVTVTDNNSLMVPFLGEVVEIEKNLFQQVDGGGRIAFLEDGKGDITGFIHEFLPSMAAYKAPFYLTGIFNQVMLGLVGLIYLAVILRNIFRPLVARCIRRISLRNLSLEEKNSLRVSMIVAVMNIVTLGSGIVISDVYSDILGTEVPFNITLWLWLPILTCVVGLYHFYRTFLVWNEKQFGSVLARVGYSVTAMASLFMCWFYYFWNILGFHYFS